jgi:Flp pilus assembly protein TadG
VTSCRWRRLRHERGAVTAELALGIPLLLAVVAALVWLLAVGAGQVRVVDAAREAARSLARGDDRAAAVARAEQVAGEGARVSVTSAGGDVRVLVTRDLDGPGGLLDALPGATLSSEAVASVEGVP